MLDRKALVIFAEIDRIANGANDNTRAALALFGAAGKRLMYRDSSLA